MWYLIFFCFSSLKSDVNLKLIRSGPAWATRDPISTKKAKRSQSDFRRLLSLSKLCGCQFSLETSTEQMNLTFPQARYLFPGLGKPGELILLTDPSKTETLSEHRVSLR